jgi:hypothetical protein
VRPRRRRVSPAHRVALVDQEVSVDQADRDSAAQASGDRVVLVDREDRRRRRPLVDRQVLVADSVVLPRPACRFFRACRRRRSDLDR